MDDGGIKLTVWNINGVRCETRNQIDNKDINDFEPGAIDVFESKENLGNCFHFELPDKVQTNQILSAFLISISVFELKEQVGFLTWGLKFPNYLKSSKELFFSPGSTISIILSRKNLLSIWTKKFQPNDPYVPEVL